MTKKDYFYSLTDSVSQLLDKSTHFLASYSGETSDFVRFNKGKVRQAGTVEQGYFDLDLIRGKRHVEGSFCLTGSLTADKMTLARLVERSLAQLPDLPEDPHLLYSTEVASSENIQTSKLTNGDTATGEILETVSGLDFVGIYAAGAIHRGFANSFGQKNWQTGHSFNLDFSVYHEKDKAVKNNYAGFAWNRDDFVKKIEGTKESLASLKKPAKTIEPGRYRVYLTPSAVYEVLSLIAWGGFSLKGVRTKQSPLCRLVESKETLSPLFSLSENTADGIAPSFEGSGFIKPGRVDLIKEGRHAGSLTSPRSAAEFDVRTDGANGEEMPESLDLSGGSLAHDQIFKELHTGVYVSNLWYLNYSDKPSARMTGMTRFATFWVENGQIVAPLNVMRFDDSFYRIFGKNLTGLTRERDLLIDPQTYGARSTTSARLPGALVEDFAFTL